MVIIKDAVSSQTASLSYAGACANREYYDAQITKLKDKIAELSDKRDEMDNICFVLQPLSKCK